jgi:hypothetical protein
MNPIKTLFVIAALTVSSLLWLKAVVTTFARMEAARSNSMESYQVAQTKIPSLLSLKAKPKRWTTKIAKY